jgi:hypothetical protein
MSFKTDDLFLAAYLVAGGHSEYRGVSGAGNGKKAVILTPEPPTDKINHYYSGEAASSLLAFSEAYKRLLASLRNTPVTV